MTLPQTDLSGRTAIVTGASRGIGLAIARSLIDAGASVVLTARTQEAADEAATSLGSDRAVGIAAHAAHEDEAQACVDQTIERFGSLDVLVCNAGTNPAFGPVTLVEKSRFDKTFEINTWAPVMWTGLAARAYMGEHGGSVIHTTSIGGYSAGGMLGVYGASKAALIHLTAHMAIEFAPKIRVNSIAPGVVRTKLAEALWKEHEAAVAATIPMQRIGEPEDIGPIAAFLASDAARWITGQTIVADGGQLAARTGEG
jgi:NAD(P)-dependent dehydrogenase (short-subunit alcohol dehydrogenase family)